MENLLTNEQKLKADISIVNRHLEGILSNPIVLKNSEVYFFIEDAATKLKEEFEFIKECD